MPAHDDAKPRPNFFVIGAPKCGTTSLYNYLVAHPDIGMSSVKEPDFFTHEENFAKGFGWYEMLFVHCVRDNGEPLPAIGEATTHLCTYWLHPHAAERLHEYAPDARLIFVVRHPFDRLVSLYIEQQMTHSIPPMSFEKWLPQYERFDEATDYWKQLEVYRAMYPDANIQVVFTEDLKDDPQMVCRKIARHIGVHPDRFPPPADKSWNVSSVKRVDTPAMHAIRSSPLHKLYDVLPMGLKNTVRKVVKGSPLQRNVKVPEWTDELRAQAAKRLNRDNMRKILEFGGRDESFWKLD